MQYEKSYYKSYDLANLKREPLLELEEYSLKAAKEGIVLLENKTNMLPLKKGDRVSVFGALFSEQKILQEDSQNEKFQEVSRTRACYAYGKRMCSECLCFL